MYKITADPASRRLDVDFVGSYTDIDQAAFAADLRAAVLKLRGGSGHFDLLCDFSQISVMPQDRTADAREQIEWCVANGLRRSANVVSSMISRMQLQRLSADDHFQNFASRAEALAWLRSPD